MARHRDSLYPKKILAFIKQYWIKYSRSPTIREINNEMEMNSTSHVEYYLKQLEDDGLIQREGNRIARTIVPKGMKVTFDG